LPGATVGDDVTVYYVLSFSTIILGLGKNVLDYVTRHFNASSVGLIEFGSWTFAGKPLYAIPSIQLSPESAEVSRFLKEVSLRTVCCFRAELDCS
jgi:hypothetical protein